MSTVDKKEFRECEYSKFDKYSTDILETVLRADFDAPEAERMPVEQALYIAHLLAERKGIKHKEAAAAKAEFYKDYYPLAEREEDFFALSEDDVHLAGEESNQTEIMRRDNGYVEHKRLWRRFAAVAAAFVLLVFGGTLSAQALGYNPWQVIARWTDENFWFEPVASNPADGLKEKLLEYGITEQVAPCWLPEGYKLVNDSVFESTTRKEISFLYVRTTDDGDESLGFDVTYRLPDDNSTAKYQKDDTEIVNYMVNDINHYIMHNVNCRGIIWQNGSAECSISGQFDVDEAKKIIDSIYEE